MSDLLIAVLLDSTAKTAQNTVPVVQDGSVLIVLESPFVAVQASTLHWGRICRCFKWAGRERPRGKGSKETLRRRQL